MAPISMEAALFPPFLALSAAVGCAALLARTHPAPRRPGLFVAYAVAGVVSAMLIAFVLLLVILIGTSSQWR